MSENIDEVLCTCTLIVILGVTVSSYLWGNKVQILILLQNFNENIFGGIFFDRS